MEGKEEYQKFLDLFSEEMKYADDEYRERFANGEVTLLVASRAINVPKNNLWYYCKSGKLSYRIEPFDALITKWISLDALFELAKQKEWI